LQDLKIAEQIIKNKQQLLLREVDKDRLISILENLNNNLIYETYLFLENDELSEVQIGCIVYKLRKKIHDRSSRDALSEIIFKLKNENVDFLMFDEEGHLIERFEND